ncbi:hypothetical protein AVEN_172347-1 [Araneus ventricosus]|uniref:Mariner Mos1 transposase n=1 Tax=Araneus ventricosus TaxID=182803 RepID=A0A4Y2E5B8_ARAVE|nr:hypothetical protein AVEN_172347-1 [Araneus ventricosus]
MGRGKERKFDFGNGIHWRWWTGLVPAKAPQFQLSGCCSTDQRDLAPSYLHLFGPLKQHLGGKHFGDDDDVQHEILLWMRQQPKEFYAAGIRDLIKRWDKRINIGGDYVEK